MSELTLATFEEYSTEDFRVLYLENVPQNIVYFQGPLGENERLPHPQIPGLYYSPTIVMLCNGSMRVENSSDDTIIDAVPGMLSVWRTPGRYKFITTSGMTSSICLTPKANKIHFRDTIYFSKEKQVKYTFNTGWIISNVNFELDGVKTNKFELIKVSGDKQVSVEENGWVLHVWL